MDAIKPKTTSALYDKERSSAFYEERYAQEYMDAWPPGKKQRILEVIRQFPWLEKGEALNYGCGNGVHTDQIMSGDYFYS